MDLRFIRRCHHVITWMMQVTQTINILEFITELEKPEILTGPPGPGPRTGSLRSRDSGIWVPRPALDLSLR